MPTGGVYSVNQANQDKWNASTRAYIDECAATKTLRYVGSMVADVHRTLCTGGRFTIPPTRKTGGKVSFAPCTSAFPCRP